MHLRWSFALFFFISLTSLCVHLISNALVFLFHTWLANSSSGHEQSKQKCLERASGSGLMKALESDRFFLSHLGLIRSLVFRHQSLSAFQIHFIIAVVSLMHSQLAK